MWERNMDFLPSCTHPDQGSNPDWELNLWPSDLQDNTPTNLDTLAKAEILIFFKRKNE